MAFVIKNRVKETTTTTGTGTVTLLGASTGFQSFAAIGNANTTYYTIAAQSGNEWEVGIGTFTSSGTTLARTTVLSNSSGTEPSALSFSAGTKDVFVTYPSERAIYGDVTGSITPVDNALVRFDSTAGNIIQTSLVTVADDGAITAPQAGSIIPFYFANQAAFPSASTYHGAIAHSHADGAMYFAHGGVWTRILDASTTVTVAQGGTGQTTYTNGQLLIGNTTGNTLAKTTLTAGCGVTITNGAGAITISASGGGSPATPTAAGIVYGKTVANLCCGIFKTALGYSAGLTTQGSNAVAIGGNAGKTCQGTHTVAVGNGAGQTTQGTNAIAVGKQAGYSTQGPYTVAIGSNAGQLTQGQNAIAVGNGAGYCTQGTYAVAVGNVAGAISQGSSTVAVGYGAGYCTQGFEAIAIGYGAGYCTQGFEAIAIGKQAGCSSQGCVAIAIGSNAGQTTQGTYAVAIGNYAGQLTQGTYAVAIGSNAGYCTQSANAIAIGQGAGQTTQGANAIAIGSYAACWLQCACAIAIGNGAGGGCQPSGSIAIGVTTTSTGSCQTHIGPIRNASTNYTLKYNPCTREISYT